MSLNLASTGCTLASFALIAGGCSSWHGANATRLSSYQPAQTGFAPGNEFIVDEQEFETNLDDQLTFVITDNTDVPTDTYDEVAFDQGVNPHGIFEEPVGYSTQPANGNSPVTIYGELPSNLGTLSTRPAAGETENLS
ncbi:MAG: hypothetical protein ACYTF7_04845, partial [Planctomycetota bacterium]